MTKYTHTHKYTLKKDDIFSFMREDILLPSADGISPQGGVGKTAYNTNDKYWVFDLLIPRKDFFNFSSFNSTRKCFN